MTTDPGQPRPAVVLAHGFGGTKDDSRGHRPDPGPGRLHGDHLHRPRVRALRRSDPPQPSRLRGSRCPPHHRPGRRPGGGAQGPGTTRWSGSPGPRTAARSPCSPPGWTGGWTRSCPRSPGTGSTRPCSRSTGGRRRGLTGRCDARHRGAGCSSRAGRPGCSPAPAAAGAHRRRSGVRPVHRRAVPRLPEAAETGRASRALTALLAQSGPQSVLADVTAPTLIIAGEDDTLFPLDHADANLRGLPASTTARMNWVAGGHDGDLSVGRPGGGPQVWFGRYLQGDGSAADTSFSVLVPETPLVGQGGVRDAETRVAAAYPGRGADRGEQRFGLAGERQTDPGPARRHPGRVDQPAGQRRRTGRRRHQCGRLRPGRAAGPVRDLHHRAAAGPGAGDRQRASRARGHPSSAPSATLFVSAVGPRPRHRAVPERPHHDRTQLRSPAAAGRGAGPAERAHPGPAERVTVALPPVSHQVPVEHRLQVVVSTTDQAYALPDRAAVYQVALAGDRTLVLPAGGAGGAGRRRPRRAPAVDRGGRPARLGGAGGHVLALAAAPGRPSGTHSGRRCRWW